MALGVVMAKDKRPAFQFYPGDWMKDPSLRSCSAAARGLWIDIICLMFESPTRGHLLQSSGTLVTPDQLARITGETPRHTRALLAELEAAGVYSVTDNGVMFSRRMVRDEAFRQSREENGNLGGRPPKPKGNLDETYREPTEKPTPNLNITPSSSSSSSSSPSGIKTDAPATPGAPTLPKASRIRGPEAVSVPTAIDTDTFRAKWAEWCEYRAAKKKPVSGHAAGAMLSKLAKFGEATAIKAIEASIENDYQGIFPERESNNGTPQRRDGRRADGTRPGEYAQPDASDIPY